MLIIALVLTVSLYLVMDYEDSKRGCGVYFRSRKVEEV